MTKLLVNFTKVWSFLVVNLASLSPHVKL